MTNEGSKKNIVICSDGTNSEFGRRNTNVVRLYQSVVRDDRQIAFYDPGVGTFSFLGREVGRRVGRLLGSAFGAGIQQNIEDAYRYLMEHYEEGDKVFLFGFSRGAFTVRALAGMLYLCGLLQPGHGNLVPYASKLYNRHERTRVAEEFKATFSRECPIHFIGVWDTVGSLGWFVRKKRFDTYLNPDAANCYQAVAIDEVRRQFPVMLWDPGLQSRGQIVEQVWFPGSHSDIGGWNRRPRQATAIPDVTLAWMLENAARCDLLVNDDWRSGLKCEPLVINESWRGVWRLWPRKRRYLEINANLHSIVNQIRDARTYCPKNLSSRVK